MATLHLISSYGARQDIRIHTNDLGEVDRFELETQPPRPINTWHDVDAVLSKTGARYSYQVAKVNNGSCDPVAGTNSRESLPLASIFKLYVLHALARAIKNGTVSWDDQLTVTAKSKAVGSSGLELAPGDQVSVRTAAEKMIATSDNMATDLLIGRLGTHAIEEALATAGHHDPASMTPFPTMYELFSVGWGQPDVREQWQQASPTRACRSCWSRRIPLPMNLIHIAPTLRHPGTAPSGTAAPRTSAECTWRCRLTRSAAPHPCGRSCPRLPASSWTATYGGTSPRKPVGCRVI